MCLHKLTNTVVSSGYGDMEDKHAAFICADHLMDGGRDGRH